jgi:hypothetical protein
LLGVLLLPPFLRGAFAGASLVPPAIFALLVARTMIVARGSRLLSAVLLCATGAVVLRGARVSHLIVIEHWGLNMAVQMLTLLGLGFVVYQVLRDVLTSGPVNSEKLYAAISAYLLIGLTFATMYEAVSFWKPHAFSIAEQNPDDFEALVYFSLVTLSTVGYGDIVPAIPEARVLAVGEAILGQFYLAVLMARLVGLHLNQAGTELQTGSSDAEDQ